MKTKILTLMTDFGNQDPFVGVMKGVILSKNPKLQLVDLTHEISRHDVTQASWAIFQSYRYFPAGTVHLLVVDPGVGSQRRAIGTKIDGQFFICPDNGILSLIWKEAKKKKAFELSPQKMGIKKISQTFHGRDLFAPAAALLSRGTSLKKLGEPLSSLKLLSYSSPKALKGQVRGEIVAVDQFGNLMSNLPENLLKKRSKIFLNRKRIPLVQSYSEGKRNSLSAILASQGYLEFFLKENNALKKGPYRKGTLVEIQYES